MKTTIKGNLTEWYLLVLNSKKIIVLLLGIIIAFNVNAQEDTTKIKMGKKKIIIVENQNNLEKGITDLNKGKADFEAKKAETNAKIAQLQAQISELVAKRNSIQGNDAQAAEINKQILEKEAEKKELNKQIDAYEKGIDQIDEEIADMNDDLEDMKNDEKGNKHNEDFDFDTDKFKINKKRNHFDGHWSGFEIGLNNFLDNNQKMELPTAENGIDGQFMELNSSKSIALSWNIFQIDIPVVGRYAGFVTGMGLEWNNYRFKKNIDLYEDANGIMRGELIDPSVKDFKKNTLNTTYLTVPLLFEIQIPNHFFVNVGVIGGLKIMSRTKQFYHKDGDYIRNREKGDYQISPLRYEATARIGYRSIQLFANYSLVPLFEKNKGPELYPFTVGLRLDF